MKKLILLLLILAISFYFFLELKSENTEMQREIEREGQAQESQSLKNVNIKKKDQNHSVGSLASALPKRGSQAKSNQSNDLTFEERVEKEASDHKFGTRHFSSLQAYTPSATKLIRKAFVKHELLFIQQIHALSKLQESTLTTFLSELFNDRLEGQSLDEQIILNKIETELGEAAFNDYLNLKTSFEAAEIEESVSRRLESLDKKLTFEDYQVDIVEEALFRLEEKRKLQSLNESEPENLKVLHEQRVEEFNEELRNILNEEQYSSYLQGRESKRKNPGINPFVGN